MPSVLLIHGGLWENTGADWFWRRTGVVDRRRVAHAGRDRAGRAWCGIAAAR
ncbi:MAG: hypothetical protein ABSA02_40655 [Trebonia sp.]